MKPQEFIISGEPQRRSAMAYIAAVKLDVPLKLTIAPHKKKRSLSQMGLYFMWLTEAARIVSEDTGMDVDDFHLAMKERFLTPRIVQVGDQILKVYSTKGLTVQDMSAYLDKIYQFIVGEWGILLPLPEDRLAR